MSAKWVARLVRSHTVRPLQLDDSVGLSRPPGVVRRYTANSSVATTDPPGFIDGFRSSESRRLVAEATSQLTVLHEPLAEKTVLGNRTPLQALARNGGAA